MKLSVLHNLTLTANLWTPNPFTGSKTRFLSSVCIAACYVASVVSDSVQHYGLQPTRLLCPWDSPGKDTGGDCRSLLQGIFLTQESNPHLFCLLNWQGGFFTTSATWEAVNHQEQTLDPLSSPPQGYISVRSVFASVLVGGAQDMEKRRD